jgi:hypothetical protein
VLRRAKPDRLLSGDMSESPVGPTPPSDVPGGRDLPRGYCYRTTRYADDILRHAFPGHWEDLTAVLGNFSIDLAELQAGGGNRTPFVTRFDRSLGDRGWGKRNFDIKTTIDGEPVSEVRSHEIDMFDYGRGGDRYPGVAVEMEWNNKDPFFDRDLTNFYALHRSGALAVGVVVTRGPDLQRLLKRTVRNPKGEEKYGESSTHWEKLVPRVELGGGGECPLLLVGIQPARVNGIEVAVDVLAELEAADERFAAWRDHWPSYRQAQRETKEAKQAALERMPEPQAEEDPGE